MQSVPSSELLLGIINTIDCGLLVMGADKGVVHANAWARRVLGIGAKATLEEVGALGGADWRAFVLRMAESGGGEIQAFVVKTASGDGTWKRLVLQGTVQRFLAAASDGGGGAEVTIATLTDMTHRDAFERQLQEFNQHLAELSDTTLNQAVELKHVNASLEQKVLERTAELRETNLATVRMLAIASEARDADTGEHVLRIQRYVELIAGEMGVKEREARGMGFAAILHDVGKIHLPDRILLKAGPLTAEERKEMEGHTVTGERILAANKFFAGAAEIARGHHENWDGSGYPDGRAKGEISLAARITHVADVFDALASARVYKEAWPPERVVAAIREGRGKMFDPEVVGAFEGVVAKGGW